MKVPKIVVALYLNIGYYVGKRNIKLFFMYCLLLVLQFAINSIILPVIE